MNRFVVVLITLGLLAATSVLSSASAQSYEAPPSPIDPRIQAIVDSVSAERLEEDIRALAAFGTRHTLSDTLSETRGIGAARRWLKAQYEQVSEDCGGCLEIVEQRFVVGGEDRIPDSTTLVNVLAIQRGTTHVDRYVVMSGDIDSRALDVMDDTSDAPGANDNASGLAGTIEAARVLSQHQFGSTIVYAGLSGEEQGLFGGQHMADVAREEGWDVVGVLNNDMIGNIEGGDGVVDNTIFRVFSQPFPVTASEEEIRRMRFFGGEVDGPSRQLARYVARTTDVYLRHLDAMMIYRLDRFGRGGHHRPFNGRGLRGRPHHGGARGLHRAAPGRPHRERHRLRRRHRGGGLRLRRKLTAVNAATLAALAWAPPAPPNVRIGGIVEPSTTLAWDAVDHPDLAGYKLYWRRTTAPQWEEHVFVGPDVTRHTLENVIIDNYLFGVAAVGKAGTRARSSSRRHPPRLADVRRWRVKGESRTASGADVRQGDE